MITKPYFNQRRQAMKIKQIKFIAYYICITEQNHKPRTTDIMMYSESLTYQVLGNVPFFYVI